MKYVVLICARDEEKYIHKGNLIMKYVVLICARDEEKYIASCLASVYFQTCTPEMVVVVDDGSTDYTFARAMEFHGRMPLTILRKEDRGFSAVGSSLLADTYNLGLDYLSSLEWDCLLILGADTSIPPFYVESLIWWMTPKRGVVSGRYPGIKKSCTSGTGRLIKREIMEELGGRVPESYAWEGSIVHCAHYMGLETRSFNIPIYNLRPPKTRKRGYINTGRSMKERGYFWPHVIYASYTHARKGRIWMAFQVLIGYLTYSPERPLPKWAQHNYILQRESIKKKMVKLKTNPFLYLRRLF